MVIARHINMDARMIWQSLRSEARAMSAAQVRLYWSPTFTDHEVVDALQRLLAGRHVEAVARPNREHLYFVGVACQPLPGFAVAAVKPPAGVQLQ